MNLSNKWAETCVEFSYEMRQEVLKNILILNIRQLKQNL